MVKLSKGKVSTPIKAVIYGAEGIGKSTLASKMPGAVFIDLEQGTMQLDVNRVSKRYQNYDEVMTDMADLIKDKDSIGLKTLVIDTVDALEMLIIKKVCQKYHKTGIEDFGYGKGYTFVGEEMKRFLEACDGAIARGVNVTLLGHAKITKFEQPDEMGAYDRWSMKLTKMSAPLVKEWADMLLFCNYKTTVITDSDTKKKKAKAGERVMYSAHHSCWDAKNRFDFPEEMPLEFEPISKIYEVIAEVKQEEKPADFGLAPEVDIGANESLLPFDISEPIGSIETVESVELRGLRSLMAQDGITEEQILNAFKGRYSAIENIEPEVITAKLLDKWQSFITYIKGGNEK